MKVTVMINLDLEVHIVLDANEEDVDVCEIVRALKCQITDTTDKAPVVSVKKWQFLHNHRWTAIN